MDRLVGEAVEVAEAHGLAVPGVRRLVEFLRDIEEGGRSQGQEDLAARAAALPR